LNLVHGPRIAYNLGVFKFYISYEYQLIQFLGLYHSLYESEWTRLKITDTTSCLI